jgi:hypothetical protein
MDGWCMWVGDSFSFAPNADVAGKRVGILVSKVGVAYKVIVEA